MPSRHRPLLALLCAASLALALPAHAEISLAQAIDGTIAKLKRGEIRNFHILWGPQDGNIAAAIAAAPASSNDTTLLEAVQSAKAQGLASSPPPSPFTPDLLGAIQTAKSSAGIQACINILALGSTGGYQDNPLCVTPSNSGYVRSTILTQSGWQLLGSFNNIDQAISPDGLGVLFLYSPQDTLRQVQILVNGAQ